MAMAVTIAAAARHATTSPSPAAQAVPTSTGTTAAGSVRGRAPATHRFTSGAPGELREVGRALLLVGVAALLGLLRHVEEQVRVVGQLLDPGEAVLLGVEA